MYFKTRELKIIEENIIMGCSSCSSNKSGEVSDGCGGNGGGCSSCSSRGCERKDVTNWLTDLPSPNGKKGFDVVEVSFKNGRKEFYRNDKNISLFKGDTVTVEGGPGFDLGIVMMTGELVKHQMKRKKNNTKLRDLKRIIRKSTESELESWKEARSKEYETMHAARESAIKLGLKMKISDVEYQGDGKKASFYYTADQRVDFRELIRVLADRFKVRIEMKQIGSRQEAGRLGGIGSCGRESCCSTWMTDFRSVSTSAARYQQLALNPEKLAGQCGKLKCCLNFELDQYADALKMFPNNRKVLKTKEGDAVHIKTDVFRRTMWYLVKKEKGQNEIVPLEIDKVFEVLELNKKGTIPKNLKNFVVVEVVEVEPAYENVVGQDDLTRFDNKFKKNKRNNRNKNNRNRKPRTNNKTGRNKVNNTNKNNNNKQQGEKKEGDSTIKPNRRNNNRNKNNRNNKNRRNNTNANKKPKQDGNNTSKKTD